MSKKDFIALAEPFTLGQLGMTPDEIRTEHTRLERMVALLNRPVTDEEWLGYAGYPSNRNDEYLLSRDSFDAIIAARCALASEHAIVPDECCGGSGEGGEDRTPDVLYRECSLCGQRHGPHGGVCT